jgi:hypothetical protein
LAFLAEYDTAGLADDFSKRGRGSG